MINSLNELNDALASIGSDVSTGLARVKSGRRGAGAGAIGHSDGLIVTAAHVLENGPFSVRLQDGTELPAAIQPVSGRVNGWARSVFHGARESSGRRIGFRYRPSVRRA